MTTPLSTPTTLGRPVRAHPDLDGPRTPFATLRPALAVIAATGLLALAGSVGADSLDVSRWLGVHLFTLGPLTIAIVAFSDHLAAGFTGQDTRAPRLALLVVGAAAVWYGLPAGNETLVAGGATVATAGVMQSYLRLRSIRKAAPEHRWAWIVRGYERAHGAFVHGAILGALIGTGVLSGSWWLAARTAHLHVMVVGFAGVTVLASVVIFGPAVMRARMADGAAERGQQAVGLAATGATVAGLSLLLTGAGGGVELLARALAATALTMVTLMAAVVARDVVRAAAARSVPRARAYLHPMVGVSLWLPLALVADVLVVLSGTWRWLDVVGVIALVGVLVQALLGVLAFAAVQATGATVGIRRVRMERLEAALPAATVLLNLGVVVLVAVQLG